MGICGLRGPSLIRVFLFVFFRRGPCRAVQQGTACEGCAAHGKADKVGAGGQPAAAALASGAGKALRRPCPSDLTYCGGLSLTLLRCIFHAHSPATLSQLLAQDVRRERNVILQCVQYIVAHNFFDEAQTKAVPDSAEPEGDGQEDEEDEGGEMEGEGADEELEEDEEDEEDEEESNDGEEEEGADDDDDA